MVSDDHEGIKSAVASELPGVEWQRCRVHFERNVLSSVPASAMSEVAEDLTSIFKVRREKTARALAEEFAEHHAKLRTTNMLERLFKEIKRRTRVVGVFPSERSVSTLATEIALRSSEVTDALETAEKPNPQHSRH